MKKIWFRFVLFISKLIILLCKILKKQGSMISGKIACKMQKDFIKYFTNIDYTKVYFVTGTNGKSTTTNLLFHTLKTMDKSVCSNKEGANMIGGVATTLIKNSNIFGKFNKEYMVLEVDERSLRNIFKYLPAKNLCISNLQKDQVQRNGDPDFIYQMFKNSLSKDVTLYVNNEEVRSRSLEDFVDNSVYFSLERNSKSFIKNDFYDVTCPCPKCSHKIKYDYYNIDNIGSFKCTNCDYKSLDKTDVLLKEIDFENKTFKYNDRVFNVKYANPFMFYNYALVISVCKKLNITDDKIEEAFISFVNPADRRETYTYHGKTIRYLRIKQENPETFQNALDTVFRDKDKKALYIGLYEVKDFKPAYNNSFYFFDCDFKKIVNTDVEKYVSFSKTVAYETANRMLYAGIKKDKLKIYDVEDDFDLIFEDIDKLDSKTIYIITGMKPYKKIKAFFNKEGENND